MTEPPRSRTCPVCNRIVPSGDSCPTCRARQAERGRMQRSAWMLVGAGIVVLVLLFAWMNQIRAPAPRAAGGAPATAARLEPDGAAASGAPEMVAFGQETCVPWNVSATDIPLPKGRFLILGSRVIDPYGLIPVGFTAGCGEGHQARLVEDLGPGALKALAEKERPDALVVIGVLALRRAREEVPGLPILFAGIPNPVSLGLDSGNTAGISPWIPVEPILRHTLRVLPQSQTIALLHPEGRLAAMGKEAVRRLTGAGRQAVRIELGPGDLDAKLEQAAEQAGAWLVLIDRKTIDRELFNRIQIRAEQNRIPLAVSDEEHVRLGALVGVGPDSHRVGQQLCRIAGALERGRLPGSGRVFCPEYTYSVVSQTVAEKLGYMFDPLEVPQSKVYKWR